MAMIDTRKALLWSAFFVVWLVAQPVLADACRMPARTEAVTTRFVIDGDTLELTDGRRVRLVGVDTPEVGRRGKPSQPFARAAKERLQELASDQGLRMYVGPEAKDRYGRTLGHLFDAKGHNIEAQLLGEGLGFALAVPPNTALAACHMRAEQLARSASVGLWQSSPVIAAQRVGRGGFHLIAGRVTAITEAGKYYWLDMDGNLVLRIGAEEVAAVLPGRPEALLGRQIEVRGWVIDRQNQKNAKAGQKRFMLPVRHAMMLQIK